MHENPGAPWLVRIPIVCWRTQWCFAEHPTRTCGPHASPVPEGRASAERARCAVSAPSVISLSPFVMVETLLSLLPKTGASPATTGFKGETLEYRCAVVTNACPSETYLA